MFEEINSEKIGWNFPPTGGGTEDGLNHPGAAHFSGDRLHSLAREILQNSLDARQSSEKPVSVTFEVKELVRDQIPGVDELVQHIDACIEQCRNEANPDVERQLQSARSILKRRTVTFLKVYDTNTIGLRKSNWNALVKGSGKSVKADNKAGGSHGIGKNAAFVVTPTRTVYYWSAFETTDSASSLDEKFQGKSVLMCHDFDGEQRQGSGFFGIREKCKELQNREIPNDFRILDQNQNAVQGTAIWIAGFKGESGWQLQIARHIIKNFFYAIDQKILNVVLEPDESNDEELIDISKATLDDWVEKLENEYSDTVRHTRDYLRLIRDPSLSIVHEDEDLGTCRLWVELGDDYPRHVGLLRSTGMLITTRQKEITRFRGVHDFIALCIFEGEEGNILLRDMENPKHDQFEVDRLPEDKQKKGSDALKRVTKWIRESVRDIAKRTKEINSEQLAELSRYLPLTESDGPLDLKTNGEKSFGNYGNITKRRIKIRTYLSPKFNSGDEDNDEDDDDPPNGGGSNGRNGSGEREGGSGNGNAKVHRQVEIMDVRVVQVVELPGLCRVSFVPKRSATITLKFAVAGDQSYESRDDLRVVSISEKGELKLSTITTCEVVEKKRFSIDVYDPSPIPNVAWVVYATEESN